MSESHVPPERSPRHPPDAHVDALLAIAAAIDRQAEATVLLARATAGEFDQGEEVEPATDLTGRPLR
jgi:hypothetical protein